MIVNMTILRHISAILVLIVMVNGQNWRIMSNGTVDYRNTYIQKYLANLAEPAAETDKLFKSMGYGNASDFLINLMGQESHYGASYKPDATHTMTYAQIDPVRYWELLDDMKHYPGWANKAKTINKHMQSKPGYEDWDIANMAKVKATPKAGFETNAPGGIGPYGDWEINANNFDFHYVPGSISPHTADPLTAMMLSRLMLTKDPKAIPISPQEQAERWDSFWNRNPAEGTGTAEFLNKLPYREVYDMMNNYNKTKSAYTR